MVFSDKLNSAHLNLQIKLNEDNNTNSLFKKEAYDEFCNHLNFISIDGMLTTFFLLSQAE